MAPDNSGCLPALFAGSLLLRTCSTSRSVHSYSTVNCTERLLWVFQLSWRRRAEVASSSSYQHGSRGCWRHTRSPPACLRAPWHTCICSRGWASRLWWQSWWACRCSWARGGCLESGGLLCCRLNRCRSEWRGIWEPLARLPCEGVAMECVAQRAPAAGFLTSWSQRVWTWKEGRPSPPRMSAAAASWTYAEEVHQSACVEWPFYPSSHEEEKDRPENPKGTIGQE